MEAVLKEIKGFDADIASVKFACAATNKGASTKEQEIVRIGAEHNITVEII